VVVSPQPSASPHQLPWPDTADPFSASDIEKEFPAGELFSSHSPTIDSGPIESEQPFATTANMNTDVTDINRRMSTSGKGVTSTSVYTHVPEGTNIIAPPRRG
jgi:hypothetical protein